MKEIHITLPKDILRSLLDGKQANYPYTLPNPGLAPDEPLRLIIFAQPETPRRKFRGRI